MQPRDQLFATLDVTMHAGRLPNSVFVLYADTIGFISNIPTDLIESFTAVLEDVNNAVCSLCIVAETTQCTIETYNIQQ